MPLPVMKALDACRWSQKGVWLAAPAVWPPTSVTMLLLVGEPMAASAWARNVVRLMLGSTLASQESPEGAHAWLQLCPLPPHTY